MNGHEAVEAGKSAVFILAHTVVGVEEQMSDGLPWATMGRVPQPEEYSVANVTDRGTFGVKVDEYLQGVQI